MDLRACNNKISAGRVPRRANRSGQVPIRVEEKDPTYIWPPERHLSWAYIIKRRRRRGLKKKRCPTPTSWPETASRPACVCECVFKHTLIYCPVGCVHTQTHALTHARTKRFPRARICKFSHGQFLLPHGALLLMMMDESVAAAE